ncbi:hypothetical protein F5Y15DRAFT_429959 [Xylariaceae sp. FL0016]|nr:hypothetical protein F5Y15DRAFT_429959 [Xylariaceae sp. FL0016]
MLRVQRQRAAQGKQTMFYRNGRPVDIAGYLKRNGLRGHDVLGDEGASDASLLEYLRALTPPLPRPTHAVLPSHLQAQDLLTSCFRNLAISWAEGAHSPALLRARFDDYFQGGLCEALRNFSRACQYFSQRDTAHGALLSERAFAGLHTLKTTSSAIALFDFLDCIIVPDHGLLRELCRYLASYARIGGAPESVFAGIFSSLHEIFDKGSLQWSVAFILHDLGLFESRRTSLPAYQRWMEHSACQAAPSPGRIPKTAAAPEGLQIKTVLLQHGPLNPRTIHQAQATVQRSAEEPTDPTAWVYHWISWQVLGHYHVHAQHQHQQPASSNSPADHSPAQHQEMAHYALERAIDVAEPRLGIGDPKISETMRVLEDSARAVKSRREVRAAESLRLLREGKLRMVWLDEVMVSKTFTGIFASVFVAKGSEVGA